MLEMISHPGVRLSNSDCKSQAVARPPTTVRGTLCTCTGETTPTVAVGAAASGPGGGGVWLATGVGVATDVTDVPVGWTGGGEVGVMVGDGVVDGLGRGVSVGVV